VSLSPSNITVMLSATLSLPMMSAASTQQAIEGKPNAEMHLMEKKQPRFSSENPISKNT